MTLFATILAAVVVVFVLVNGQHSDSTSVDRVTFNCTEACSANQNCTGSPCLATPCRGFCWPPPGEDAASSAEAPTSQEATTKKEEPAKEPAKEAATEAPRMHGR